MPRDEELCAPVVWVSDRPSGISCGVLLQAPGTLLSAGPEPPAAFFPVALVTVTGSLPAKLSMASGMTSDTSALALSRDTSPVETVAAIAFTSVYRLMWVACTWASSLISGCCADWTASARTAAASLPTCACPNWSFMIRITGWFTFLDSFAASEAVRDDAPACDDWASTATVTPAATRADAAVTARTARLGRNLCAPLVVRLCMLASLTATHLRQGGQMTNQHRNSPNQTHALTCLSQLDEESGWCATPHQPLSSQSASRRPCTRRAARPAGHRTRNRTAGCPRLACPRTGHR